MALPQGLEVKLETGLQEVKDLLPLAGTAVYMTSYSRLNENRPMGI